MNPNTQFQEWRATPPIFTSDHTWPLAPAFLPLPPPAPLLVPFAAPSPRPYYYFYGTTVPNNLQSGYYTSYYPPQNDDVRLHEVAPPFSGGATAGAGTEITDAGESRSLERRYAEEGESSMVIKSSSNNIKQKRSTTTAFRKEWRPKNKDQNFDNVVGGVSGATARAPPPCASRLSRSPKTTIMIKNIPNQLRRDNMLEFLDSYCDNSIAYDFFYLPIDFRTGDNFGYAFVNFTNSRTALEMKRVLRNYKWGKFQTHRGSFWSNKRCVITWADIQGKERQVERYQNSIFGCDKLEFLPVTFDPPRNGSDPKPDPIILGILRK